MQKVEVNIVRLINGVSSNENYAIILKEKKGNRRLPIVIDFVQAHSIIVALEDMHPTRPLTHDLFINLFHKLNVRIVSIFIHNLVEGVFHASIECEQNGEVFELDSRASDALALAVRHGSPPIYVEESIIEEKGFELEVFEQNDESYDGDETDDIEQEEDDYASFSIQELEDLIQFSIEEEDYEQAAELRDAIERKKLNND